MNVKKVIYCIYTRQQVLPLSPCMMRHNYCQWGPPLSCHLQIWWCGWMWWLSRVKSRGLNAALMVSHAYLWWCWRLGASADWQAFLSIILFTRGVFRPLNLVDSFWGIIALNAEQKSMNSILTWVSTVQVGQWQEDCGGNGIVDGLVWAVGELEWVQGAGKGSFDVTHD